VAREASRGSQTQPSESAMITTAASRIPIESQCLAHTAGVSSGSERVDDTGRAVVHEAHTKSPASMNPCKSVIVRSPCLETPSEHEHL
jgi:hypothetical protein